MFDYLMFAVFTHHAYLLSVFRTVMINPHLKPLQSAFEEHSHPHLSTSLVSANSKRVPIQTSFGRRPVLLASSLICLGSMIWRARAQTYGSFMGACVLNGIGAGPAEVCWKDMANQLTDSVDCTTTNYCRYHVSARARKVANVVLHILLWKPYGKQLVLSNCTNFDLARLDLLSLDRLPSTMTGAISGG